MNKTLEKIIATAGVLLFLNMPILATNGQNNKKNTTNPTKKHYTLSLGVNLSYPFAGRLGYNNKAVEIGINSLLRKGRLGIEVDLSGSNLKKMHSENGVIIPYKDGYTYSLRGKTLYFLKDNDGRFDIYLLGGLGVGGYNSGDLNKNNVSVLAGIGAMDANKHNSVELMYGRTINQTGTLCMNKDFIKIAAGIPIWKNKKNALKVISDFDIVRWLQREEPKTSTSSKLGIEYRF
jgi:hypothetical protein